MSENRSGSAFAYVTVLFFIWGAVTSANDILIPAVKQIFSLTDTESFLTQFAFFMAYGVVSLPAAILLSRVGSSKSVAIALCMAIVGGALVPLAFAQVADLTGSRFTAFFVPLACYLAISLFGWPALRAPTAHAAAEDPATVIH